MFIKTHKKPRIILIISVLLEFAFFNAILHLYHQKTCKKFEMLNFIVYSQSFTKKIFLQIKISATKCGLDIFILNLNGESMVLKFSNVRLNYFI